MDKKPITRPTDFEPSNAIPENFYSKIIEAINSEELFTGSNEIFITDVYPGGAKGSMTISKKLKNPMGGIHGGALSSLADIVAGSAAITTGYTCVTLNNTMNYLKGAKLGQLFCTGEVIKKGRTIIVIDTRITDENDELIATGTFTYFVTGDVSEAVPDFLS